MPQESTPYEGHPDFSPESQERENERLKAEAAHAKAYAASAKAEAALERAQAMKLNSETRAKELERQKEREAERKERVHQAEAVNIMAEEGWQKRHVHKQGRGWFVKDAKGDLWTHDPDAAAITNETRLKFIDEPLLKTNSAINGVTSLAAKAPEFRPPIQFDENPELIGLPCGAVVNLRNAEAIKNGDRQFVTKRIGADPTTDTPKRWLEFLNQVLPSKADAEWLQRFAGYAMTGHTREHLFAYFFGHGRNGKGVTAKVLQAAIGQYHQSVASDKMLEKDGFNAHLEWLAKLDGARLVTADELPKRPWSVNRLNQLVAGDTQTANFMRRDSFDFNPVAKIVLIGNYMPKIHGGASYSIAERIRIRDFPTTFPESARNRRLIDDLLAELPGILGWMLHGAMAYLEDGLLDETPSMAAKRAEFSVDMKGPITKWAEDAFDFTPTAWTPSSAILASARANGIAAKTVQHGIMNALKARGDKVNTPVEATAPRRLADGSRERGVQGIRLRRSPKGVVTEIRPKS